jgi:hypothetical protein
LELSLMYFNSNFISVISNSTGVSSFIQWFLLLPSTDYT